MNHTELHLIRNTSFGVVVVLSVGAMKDEDGDHVGVTFSFPYKTATDAFLSKEDPCILYVMERDEIVAVFAWENVICVQTLPKESSV